MPSTPPVAVHAEAPRIHIGMLGSYPPRLCGLATFGAALEREFIRSGHTTTVIAVDDGRTPRPASPSVHTMRNGAPGSARDAARILSVCDVAIVQHEYGIYGGADGCDVVDVLLGAECPTIAVLHTVPLHPTPHQREVLEQVCDAASRVVVMTESARTRLTAGYAVDESKLATIPHGAWSPRLEDPTFQRDPGSPLELLTWGLLGPGKGIEHMVEAMTQLRDATADVRYTVAGATHPNVLARDGEQYRDSLIQRAVDARVLDAVHFDDTYRDLRGLERLVTGASMVVLPYDSQDQVTSGVLVDAIAAGRPVISTAFPHAIELLSDGAGMLVPHRDPRALADAVRTVLFEPSVLRSMTAKAREIAPSLAWGNVAAQYVALCDSLESVSSAGARR